MATQVHMPVIRPATKLDIPWIIQLIKNLAEDQNETDAVKLGEKEMLRDGFGENPMFWCLVMEKNRSSETSNEHFNPLIGYALYYFIYSTWEGPVMHLEDLFVEKDYRNQGFGTELMRRVAQVALEKGCARMDWQVLDWNSRAINLYNKVRGVHLKEWMNYRLRKTEMVAFAEGSIPKKC